MSNIMIKEQNLCAVSKPTSKTWTEFTELYELAENDAERAMLDDLSTGLERELIMLGVKYGER